jgi:SAM-dependent methyltransferase
VSGRRPELPLPLRVVRAALRRFNIYLSRHYDAATVHGHSPAALPDVAAAEEALRRLELPDEKARAYFEKHLARLARTLTLVPPSPTSGRILELGCYMQITPFLQSLCGYSEVRGADYGPPGQSIEKAARVSGKTFQATIDLFDAERDRFPYQDACFETVLVCELIEHLLADPMHLLLQCRRVLAEGGRVLVTTPNIGSLTSVARTLHGYDNPQIHYRYSRPRADGHPAIPHVREYTAFELKNALVAAGFEVETLITEPIAEYAMNLPLWEFLEEHGYNTSLRGEQIYCVAIKRSNLPVTRYPPFLYDE